MSLLLMRAVLGIAIIIQGGTYLVQPDATITTSVLGACSVITGGLLLAGFFTPFTALAVGVNIVGVAISAFPAPSSNLFDSHPALVFAMTLVVAVIGVGPGRFSVDARMFGRREIIIPLPQSPLER